MTIALLILSVPLMSVVCGMFYSRNVEYLPIYATIV
jgi:hypothetical protein